MRWIGQLFEIGTVSIHHPDRRIAAGIGQRELVEGNLLAVVRPHRPAGVAGGQALLCAPVGVHHVKLRVLIVAQGAERDLRAVWRNRGSNPFTCRSVIPVPSGFMKARRFILASEVEWYCILGLPTELILTPTVFVEARWSAASIAIEDEVVIIGSGRTKTVFSEG
jgi:hypothetical protein